MEKSTRGLYQQQQERRVKDKEKKYSTHVFFFFLSLYFSKPYAYHWETQNRNFRYTRWYDSFVLHRYRSMYGYSRAYAIRVENSKP